MSKELATTSTLGEMILYNQKSMAEQMTEAFRLISEQDNTKIDAIHEVAKFLSTIADNVYVMKNDMFAQSIIIQLDAKSYEKYIKKYPNPKKHAKNN